MMNSCPEEFCNVDLWAAEAYLTAFDAQEKVMLDMLDREIKIHQWFLEKTMEKFCEECKKADYTYKGAKQNVHSLNYGVEPRKMSQESHLPETISEWQYNFYHNTFPGIRRRMWRIKESVEKTRELTSLLGRKKVFLGPYNRELLNQAYAWPSQSVIGELTIAALNKIYWVGLCHKNACGVAQSSLTGRKILSLPWVFPALNTHDGLAIRCFKGNREAVKAVVKDAFDVVFTKAGLSVTIPVEIAWGDNFNEAKDVEIIRYS